MLFYRSIYYYYLLFFLNTHYYYYGTWPVPTTVFLYYLHVNGI